MEIERAEEALQSFSGVSAVRCASEESVHWLFLAALSIGW